jgi:hypothetical protein
MFPLLWFDMAWNPVVFAMINAVDGCGLGLSCKTHGKWAARVEHKGTAARTGGCPGLDRGRVCENKTAVRLFERYIRPARPPAARKSQQEPTPTTRPQQATTKRQKSK